MRALSPFVVSEQETLTLFQRRIHRTCLVEVTFGEEKPHAEYSRDAFSERGRLFEIVAVVYQYICKRPVAYNGDALQIEDVEIADEPLVRYFIDPRSKIVGRGCDGIWRTVPSRQYLPVCVLATPVDGRCALATYGRLW